MKGLTNLLDRVNGNAGKERVRPAEVDVDVDPDEAVVEVPYDVRLSRPWVDIGLRVGLWVAVAFGCVGGVLALLGLTGREGDTVIQEAPAGGDVPAPVARVAERGIEVWLTAESGDDPLFDALFVEQPEPAAGDGLGGSDMTVGRVTTVGGGQYEEGYWLVTAAVEVAECVPDEVEGWSTGADTDTGPVTAAADSSALAASLTCDDGESGTDVDGTTEEPLIGEGGEDFDDDEGPAGPSSAQATTLFVEVGVVGDLDQRVTVLSTPSVVAAPPPVAEDWVSNGAEAAEPDANEPVARTVEDFLRAWLAGGGDTSRYLAPNVNAPPISPPLFSDLYLTTIAYDQDEAGEAAGETGVRAFVQATTPGGTVVNTSYELSLAFREDRWEVTAHWGAPELAGRPGEDPESAPAPTSEDDAEGTSGAEDQGVSE